MPKIELDQTQQLLFEALGREAERSLQDATGLDRRANELVQQAQGLREQAAQVRAEANKRTLKGLGTIATAHGLEAFPPNAQGETVDGRTTFTWDEPTPPATEDPEAHPRAEVLAALAEGNGAD